MDKKITAKSIPKDYKKIMGSIIKDFDLKALDFARSYSYATKQENPAVICSSSIEEKNK